MDTIFALATARGKAGVAIVRISGPLAQIIAEAMAGSLPQPRQMYLRNILWNSLPIDQAIVARFEAGASFTGEALAEFHLHGSTATISAMLRALGEQPGLRLAEPGEFTRRSFENGVMSLSEVEGLADLIEAETEAQRRQALRVLSGSIAEKVELWRQNLIRAAALVEATIDFADEDVPVDVTPEVSGLLSDILLSLRQELAGSAMAERIRDGFEVAIVGEPNVGKSTLLNALAGREAAITSARAGTTRDVIEVRMDLGGLAVTLLDTAGLRETADEVEQEGIARAILRAEQADLRVFLVEAGEVPSELSVRPGDLIVAAKADLTVSQGLAISGKTGQGVPELIAAIADSLASRVQSAGTLTRERHRIAVLDAIGALESAATELKHVAKRAELIADDLRRALRAMEALVGRVDVEDFLDEIFSSFCIGK